MFFGVAAPGILFVQKTLDIHTQPHIIQMEYAFSCDWDAVRDVPCGDMTLYELAQFANRPVEDIRTDFGEK